MTLLRILAPVLLSVLLVQAAAADRTRFRVCNESGYPLLIAILEEVGDGLIVRDWVARGWYEIQAGRCEMLSRRGTYQKAWLSVVRIEGGRRIVADFGLKPLPQRFGRPDSFGAERFFCVSDKPFNRRLNSANAHGGTCPSGYYRQLFNLFVWVEQFRQFTLRVGDKNAGTR